ncbi:MAG: nucleotidyltransferase family protein [Sulfuricurvum sp.]
MRADLEAKLRVLCSRFSSEGFVIVGISGSYARGEESADSDVDLLYEIPDPAEFAERHGGFGSFSKILEIKREIENEIALPVDLISLSSLNEIGQKYILKDLKRVS